MWPVSLIRLIRHINSLIREMKSLIWEDSGEFLRGFRANRGPEPAPPSARRHRDDELGQPARLRPFRLEVHLACGVEQVLAGCRSRLDERHPGVADAGHVSSVAGGCGAL